MFLNILAATLTLAACNEGEPIPVLEPTPTYESGSGSDIVFTEEQLRLPTKKGACFTLREPGQSGSYTENMARVQALNVGWNYSWGYGIAPNQPETIEFIPMAWGGFDPDTFLSNVLPDVNSGKYKRFLGFNEPDGEKQANMTVEKAIQLWPTLERLGIPLGSPAVVDAENGEWLEDFMAEVDRLGYRVDYICVHNYPGTSVENFKNKMTNIHNKYNRPIIVTEFAPADWTATTPAQNKHSEAAVLNFMKGVLSWMEETDFIYGYSWFSFSKTSAAGCSSALFNEDGSLTTLGEYYANFTPGSTDPDPDPEPDPDPDTGYGENLIKNGDFESATPFEFWDKSTSAQNLAIEAVNVIADSKSMRMTGVSAWADNSQTIDVEPGKTYEFGMTGRILDAAGASGGASTNRSLGLAIRKVGDAKTVYASTTPITVGVDTPVTGTITIPEDVTQVQLYISKANGIGYVDEVYFKEILDEEPAPEPGEEYGDNLVQNGDFESTTQFEFWNKKNTSGANLAIESAAANVISGTYCMRMTGVSAWADNSQTIDVEPGKTYEFGMTGRILNAAGPSGGASTNRSLGLAIRKVDDAKTVYASAPAITVGENTSTKATVTIPDGVTQVQLFISKANGIGYVDDVYFKEVL